MKLDKMNFPAGSCRNLFNTKNGELFSRIQHMNLSILSIWDRLAVLFHISSILKLMNFSREISLKFSLKFQKNVTKPKKINMMAVARGTT